MHRVAQKKFFIEHLTGTASIYCYEQSDNRILFFLFITFTLDYFENPSVDPKLF